MIKGFYYEFISMPCGYKYSMPLGILWSGKPTFKVYVNTGLYRILNSNLNNKLFNILLLSPTDPKLYYLSLIHELERKVEYDNNGCPNIYKEDIGAWYICRPSLKEIIENAQIYECNMFKHLRGMSPPYSRATGCFIELLIIYTKIKAGVKIPLDLKSYLRGLRWCISRSSSNNKELNEISNKIIDTILNENSYL